ncbi:redoxin domain-containing protein [Candidatus Thorarchaeota archaeon]|nr:MAG: redoxin domain-containing protein [Candidatus Thorarchaeota archaeon]
MTDPDSSKSPPQEGQIAPDFTLPATNGEDIQLLELSGNCVVIVFYPISFTMFSMMELQKVKDSYIGLQALGAKVLAISVDPIQTLKTLVEQEELPFILLSDFERTVAKKYGVFVEEYDGFRHVALPSVFVLNEKQRIIYRWVSDKAHELPDLDMVLSVIKGPDREKKFC